MILRSSSSSPWSALNFFIFSTAVCMAIAVTMIVGGGGDGIVPAVASAFLEYPSRIVNNDHRRYGFIHRKETITVISNNDIMMRRKNRSAASMNIISVTRKNYCGRLTTLPRKMALTEEFVQMKINGIPSKESSSSSIMMETMNTQEEMDIIQNGISNNNNNAYEDRNIDENIRRTRNSSIGTSHPIDLVKQDGTNKSTPIRDSKQQQNYSNNNTYNNANNFRNKFVQPFLSGTMALSTVQSLARVAGAGAGAGAGMVDGRLLNPNNNNNNNNLDDYDNSSSNNSQDEIIIIEKKKTVYDAYDDDENDIIFEGNENGKTMDGFNRGAFGIANVLSHRRGGVSSSTRTQLIQWQRENLRNVRKEIFEKKNSATSSLGNNASTRTSSPSLLISRRRLGREESTTINDDEDDRLENFNNRMTPLVGILQKRSMERSRNAKKGTNERNINKGESYDKKRKNRKKIDLNKQDQATISAALKTIENDMAILDVLASLQPQLSGTEVGLLLGAIVASGVGPIFFPGTSVTEVLAPAAAAFTASITIGSEYIGRVAVADGKEIAANTIQCAAEAEALLANAERVKAITPLCVGVGATCASFALLTPAVIDVLNIGNSVIMIAELYLLCPLVSVLAAAVANLALEETRGYASQAINVGVRRFSKRSSVGRTWLSSVEQIQKASVSKTDRWWSFAGSVLPAPILGSIVGGPSLSAKCIVVAALAAAQSAFFLAQAEGVLARATDAVALKARSAAVCDTYANQGARNSAILPFTSALSAFCAAATAATVELPFIDTISSLYGTIGEVVVVSTFPLISSAFAAAAAVSKARCEVDAEAAAQAASTLALEYMDGSGDDPVLRPFREVRELVRLAVISGWRSIKKGVLNPFENIRKIGKRAIMGFRRRIRWGGDLISDV